VGYALLRLGGGGKAADGSARLVARCRVFIGLPIRLWRTPVTIRQGISVASGVPDDPDAVFDVAVSG
jgi:hypothetical protein